MTAAPERTAATPEHASPVRIRGDSRGAVFGLLTVHALTWLVAANLVGLWLASLLLAPRLGLVVPAAGYGRWLPLHLDLQFYGWISLPLVGLLFAVYLPRRPGPLPRLAIGSWSAALAFSAGSWLAGRTSGKTFLEWTGPARWVWGAALAFLAVTVIAGFLRRRREDAVALPRWLRVLRAGALVAMVPVPIALLWATSPGVYPPINPDSGGATATSTLGSVLGVVAILLLAPLLVGLRPSDGRVVRRVWLALGLHFLLFALLGHGDRSHTRVDQWLGLASLVIWWPLGRAYLARFRWPAATKAWLRALGLWSALLLVSGVLATLPGVLERWKFTHVMVGHVHLALAGVCTSICVLVLLGLDLHADEPGDAGATCQVLGRGVTALVWNGGLAVHVLALTWLGLLEASTPGLLWDADAPGHGLVPALFALRWVGGATMTWASVVWLRGVAGARSSLEIPAVENPAGSAQPPAAEAISSLGSGPARVAQAVSLLPPEGP